jgi:predicted membrane GTPase involved in stress response
VVADARSDALEASGMLRLRPADIEDEQLVEVTPHSIRIRIRKRELNP